VSDKAFIIGSGGWGTALGIVLSDKFGDIRLWEHDPAYAAQVNQARENLLYLKGVPIAPAMRFQSGPEGLSESDLVVVVAPSQYLRSAVASLLPQFKPGALCVVATKGVEQGSLMTMSQVVQDEARKHKVPTPRLVSLSGPSHAEEVGRRLPTTVVAAADKLSDALECQAHFNGPAFRVYTSEDHLGVELGGSLKNVIALAAGISDGLGLGDNAKAASMTRGLAEITRLGVALGAKPATFAGLTGMGDLAVTCMSRHSRNRSVGERLGKGESWVEIQKGMKMVAEGVPTSVSARELARKYHVEMPISEAVYQVVFEAKPASEALKDLMGRLPKGEAL
jgi:glycerol-3-phosphate dehydrogenase (NAD(P)+)